MKSTVMISALLVFLCMSCSQDHEKKAASLQKQAFIVELAPFTLQDGVSEAMLLEASHAVQKEFVEKQPGFIKRELIRKSEKEYMDLAHWVGKEHAKKTAQRAFENPVCLKFFSLMKDVDPNDPNAGVLYYDLVSSYE